MYRPFGGLTALLFAAREGCLECARALVEGGADIDLAGLPQDVTPLFIAIDNFHFDSASVPDRGRRAIRTCGIGGAARRSTRPST